MNEDDKKLRLYTISFLDELDTKEGSTRYYKKELNRRYRDFCARNPGASRYKFHDVLCYVKGKKYGYATKYQVVLKPMFIHLERGKELLFTVNPGSERSGEYFVCQVCDRGFATHHSLMCHQSSNYHNKQMRIQLQFAREDNSCPMLNCNFRGRSRDDLQRHFKEGKSVRVKQDVSAEESSVEACKQRNAYCELCNIKCTSDSSLRHHQLGRKHRTNELMSLYNQGRLVSCCIL
ncbi:uncharacterized protein [Watersipora subatra]|uniref:uncharacterized protein n=1 Tax=Watersipora subatra TaxID=2589382 RepID=UPI00355BA22E